MGGGAGRGKFKGKATGRRNFSTVDEMQEGSSVGGRRFKKGQPAVPKDGEEPEEEESEEESSEEETEADKPKGVQSLIEVANPNAAKPKMMKAKDASLEAGGPELSRREREEIEKQRAKERYWKLHEQGKTEEAKKDLERLAIIKQQRADAAQKREEEKAAKEAKAKEARK